VEHVVRVQVLTEGRPLMQFEAPAADGLIAWRLFQRLCDVLKALVADEARREKGGA